MSRITRRKAGWLLGLIALVTTLVLSLNALPPDGPNGEWVQTSYSSAHSAACAGGSCQEWCQPLGHGPWGDLIPTGVLCCVDASGYCAPGSEFEP